MDDKYLVDLFWARSEEALRGVQHTYGAYCHAIAFRILGNEEDAEECVNDTYLDAWNSIPPHRPERLSLFLGKITRRVAIDRLRHRNAERRGGGEGTVLLEELGECLPVRSPFENEVEEAVLYDALRQRINSFLRGLPRVHCQMFLCRYFYADPIPEIAERFDCSESRVKSILFRTRKKLLRCLEEEHFVERSTL